MSSKRVVVRTEAALLQELKTLASEYLYDWAKTHEFNFPNIVLVAMMIIEKYHTSYIKLGSVDKFKSTVSIIPHILDMGVEIGKIDDDEATTFKKNISQSDIKDLIEAFIALAHNPKLLQAPTQPLKVKGCISMQH